MSHETYERIERNLLNLIKMTHECMVETFAREALFWLAQCERTL